MKKLLLILISTSCIGQTSFFIKDGLITDLNNPLEFQDLQLGLTQMFSPSFGATFNSDLAISENYSFMRLSAELTFSTDAIFESNQTALIRGGLTYITNNDTEILKKDRSLAFVMGFDYIYYINKRIGINLYSDLIFASKDETFVCDCKEYTLKQTGNLLTVGLGIRVKLGKEKKKEEPVAHTYITNNTYITNKIVPEKKEYTIHFPYDKDIPSEWENITDLMEHKDKKLIIVGYASTEGTDSYNYDLANRRVNNVKRLLISRGFDTNNIKVDVVGESTYAIEDLDEFKPLDRIVKVKIKRDE